MTDARRTFGPVVLAGLAGGGFAAVAGHRTMLEVDDGYLGAHDLSSLAGQDNLRVEFPLAGALALVVLACWGVLLVTRGTVRRVVAALGLVASAGILAVLVIGGFVQRDDAARDVAGQLGMGSVEPPELDPTVWFWVALACAVLALGAAAAAVRLVPAWPEMGSRYDAPTGGGAAGAGRTTAQDSNPAEQSNLDLWKSLDEGEDPTTDGPGRSD